MKRSGVYRIVNVINGACYVGSSVDIRRRFWTHFRDLELGKHHSIALTRAWRKYGPECFRFEPLIICSESDMLFYEQRCIDSLDSRYNICPVAGNCMGRKLSETDRQAKADHLRAIPRTAERYLKISASLKGRPLSEDHRLKLTISAQSRAHLRTGVPLSTETRKRMSVAASERMASISDDHAGKLEAARRRRAKLSVEQVIEVRRLRRSGVSQEKVASMFDVGYWVINAIMSGKSFAYVPDSD